jgi:benzoyl-CoA 2,3-dioxygenase component B
VIDLPTIQRYLNFHFSVTIDLFGADQSSNAATFYSTGLKGRYRRRQAHRRPPAQGPDLQGAGRVNGQLVEKEVPMLNALNEVLRDDYIKDSSAAWSAGTR